jgi:hypothetical protein
MRKAVAALLAAAALGLGILATPAVADQPQPPTCEGLFIASRVQLFTGRRSAAESFLGSYPQAVQDSEFILQGLCT